MRLSVRLQEPLARHTAVRTGGVCDAYVVAHDLEAVATVVAECRAASWRLNVLGAGTRTVVRDGPVPGAVLRLGTGFTHIVDEGESWLVGAAVPVPVLVQRAQAAQRRGVARFVAVPGSLGASLRCDEGWDGLVEMVQILRRGRVAQVALDDVIGRRSTVVLGARIQLPPGPDPLGSIGSAALIPPGAWFAPTRGEPVRDVFRSVRLHMVRLREVAIPDAAPELLVNLGAGTAADLALLSKSAVERVKKVRGDQLEAVVRWMGSARAD